MGIIIGFLFGAALIAVPAMLGGNIAGHFMMVSWQTALLYLFWITAMAFLSCITAKKPWIEDGVLAFGIAYLINAKFILHPVFNIIIFFVLFAILFWAFELHITVMQVKGYLFTAIYIIIGGFVIYKTMNEIDMIWKTFFFVIYVFMSLSSRMDYTNHMLDLGSRNIKDEDVEKLKQDAWGLADNYYKDRVEMQQLGISETGKYASVYKDIDKVRKQCMTIYNKVNKRNYMKYAVPYYQSIGKDFELTARINEAENDFSDDNIAYQGPIDSSETSL